MTNRYSKISPRTTGWVSTSEILYHNGSGWVSLGDINGGGAGGREMYVHNGSGWVKATTLPSVVTTYNAAVKVLGQQGAGETTGTFSTTSDALTLVSTNTPACGVITASTRRYHVAWISPLRLMLDKVVSTASYGWAGTNVNNDSTEDWHQFEWTNPMWIHAFRFATANSSLWNNAAHRVEISFKNANGTWTAEQTYTVAASVYTAINTWANDYFWLNVQVPAGYYGIKLRYLNNTTYHAGAQTTRMGEIELWLGTITNTTVWG